LAEVQATTGRARSLAEMAKLQGRMMRAEDFGASIADYRPLPTDVVISPFGKCGTTWLQQTFHTLRTHGDMDFDDISRVVPWIETARALGLDINPSQRAEPRGFKSHLPYDLIPKGARYIVSLRNPQDALVSMHRFMDGWFLEPGAVSVADFAAGWLGQGGGPSYWSHLVSWWDQRDNPDILLLSYEHMTDDPETNIRDVAAFCGIPLDDALLALTLERSSLAYMLAHKDRFDDAMMRRLSEERCGLPPGSDSAKVAKGGVGGHKDILPADIAAAVDAAWAERVAPHTGFADYAALEAELRARRRVSL
jgi:hypothetical protein